MKRQILNIVTFLRGAEPRHPATNLLRPLKKQIMLLKKHDLPATFLFQYDALIRDDFVKEIKKAGDRFELGVWMEMNKPHVSAAGLKWTGRFTWDWHAHCSMTVGYTEEERKKLIDAVFEKFRSVFGYYPRVLGAWAIDAFSLRYASEKYGMDAFCNCKEQWGTDGYNLWGGYYGQAYYPSVNNAFTPASKEENRIPVPMFRMLGSDPVLQYDYEFDPDEGLKKQGVITLEPAYVRDGGGGDKRWVDWFMKENYSGKCLTFAYAQAGQENSFSWARTKKGLKYQFPLFDKLRKEGKIEVETLGQTGKWFCETFSDTPPSTIVAESDWKGENKRSYWYDCKNYRLNFFVDGDCFRIRDCYLFRDGYKERYLGKVCTTNDLYYDNLPLIDGVRFSGEGILAGLYFMKDGKELTYKDIIYEEEKDTVRLRVLGTQAGDMTVAFSPEGVRVLSDGVSLVPRFSNRTKETVSATVNGNTVSLCYNGYRYSVEANTNFGPDFSLSGEDIFVRLQ